MIQRRNGMDNRNMLKRGYSREIRIGKYVCLSCYFSGVVSTEPKRNSLRNDSELENSFQKPDYEGVEREGNNL